jgi:hypothetical protein
MAPANLPTGTYELAAETWPPNRVGVGDDLTDASCGYFSVS